MSQNLLLRTARPSPTTNGKSDTPIRKSLTRHHVMMAPCVVVILMLALTPVISRDALIHHMALPKLWLQYGLWSVDTYRNYAFNPSNLHILYYLSLLANLSFLPKLIHAGFLVLTGAFIYRYLRRQHMSPDLAALAFILTLTLPINQRLAAEVYVDLGLLYFSSAALIFFLKWKNTDFNQSLYFYLAAISAGLAIGTKYNGLIPFTALTCMVVFAYARHTQSNLKPILLGLQFSVIALLLASPWLIRNALASGGNPFFPLFTSIFPDQLAITEPLYPALSNKLLYRLMSGESAVDLILIPFRLFYDGADHDFLHFDGKLNPVMLVLLLLPLLGWCYNRWKNASNSTDETAHRTRLSDQKYLAFYFLFTLAITLQNNIRIRYAIPIVTPVILLNMFTLEALVRHSSRLLKAAGLIFIAIFLWVNFAYTVELISRHGMQTYFQFKETAATYVDRNVPLAQMYEFINTHTADDAVIYDVMSGQRSYYVDREYLHDRLHVDTIFFNYVIEAKPPEAYAQYLRRFPTRQGSGATHLLIKLYAFLNTYHRMFPNEIPEAGPMAHPGLRNFMTFLSQQKLMFQVDQTFLYELTPPG